MTATLTDAYDLPQEFKDFRDTIRQIVRERVAPRAAEIDATGEYPWDIRKLFGEQDLMGLPFPEEQGGTGTGTLMLNVAIEEVARACASTPDRCRRRTRSAQTPVTTRRWRSAAATPVAARASRTARSRRMRGRSPRRRR